MIPTLIILAVVLIIPLFFIALFVVSSYNKLVDLRNR